jgi:hypothetical protein
VSGKFGAVPEIQSDDMNQQICSEVDFSLTRDGLGVYHTILARVSKGGECNKRILAQKT